jgi:ParB family chromosome partitioning protein
MKLGAVSPKLMQVYRDGAMNLEQLMTFTISDDHAERVWSELSWNKSGETIRGLLTQGRVSEGDRRAVFGGNSPLGCSLAMGLACDDLGGPDPLALRRMMPAHRCRSFASSL